ncbi:hypothetical protein WR25_24294 [Diploscapter pachys]|uniref:Uncharacterized protein n=1 Tax=Diploscapter pachys TaxID=2018661 RepID=A0A2A2J789_9BILA|nr:hypothetical protein WR25_24294 [Diploscapter pachys]
MSLLRLVSCLILFVIALVYAAPALTVDVLDDDNTPQYLLPYLKRTGSGSPSLENDQLLKAILKYRRY